MIIKIFQACAPAISAFAVLQAVAIRAVVGFQSAAAVGTVAVVVVAIVSTIVARVIWLSVVQWQGL